VTVKPILLCILFSFSFVIFAQPVGYYDSIDLSSPEALRASLHEIIDDHQRFPYTDSETDTWDILELADADLQTAGRIIDLYHNVSFPLYSGGTSDYNREHTWPRSYGFPDDHELNYPFTDCHHLYLCDPSYNEARQNKPYGDCDANCDEYPTEETNGLGGGVGEFPGHSNWTSGEYTRGTWQVWDERKGDIARAMFYMAIRYEGGSHGVTGASEPDLELTDDIDLILDHHTGENENMAYMGRLSTLLEWNRQDPPSQRERDRNDVIANFQGNRNPFVDHPEWVDMIFGNTLSEDYVYQIPHIAGAAWQTKIVIFNPTDQPLTFQLDQWDASGGAVLYNHQDTVEPFSSIVVSNELLASQGIARITSESSGLLVKMAYRFGDSQSLTEFFVSPNTYATDWLLPNTQTSWFEWFGFALANFQSSSIQLTLRAFREGLEVGSAQVINLEPMTKRVALSPDIWQGTNYSDIDMVVIQSSHPIPAPVSITGRNDQTRHVFFNGQAIP